MTDELVLYTNPMSRGTIAHWMLEEVAVPYRLELLRFDQSEHKRPEFLAINPMGKVPTLLHGKTVVTEAAAICTYLADAFPAAHLAPGLNDPARGAYLRWLFFGAGCIEPAMVDRSFDRPDVRGSVLGYGSYADTMNTLEYALTPGPFILGDTFSAADVYIGAAIGWGLMAKNMEARPRFLEYSARCKARPAYQRFNDKNNALFDQLKTT
jgi:glutathione S-transferase